MYGSRREGANKMLRMVLIVGAALALLSGVANAAVPKGSVRGVMTLGFVAKYDEAHLARKMTYKNVWCAWDKKEKHVIVHVTMQNRSVEHVTAYILPKYTLAGGGVHGNGFLSRETKGFDSGEVRSLYTDAGAPKGARLFARIGKCIPELSQVDSG
jgi:hypothetical protein